MALPLLMRVRDEAHRFTITYHRKLRGKQTLVAGRRSEKPGGARMRE